MASTFGYAQNEGYNCRLTCAGGSRDRVFQQAAKKLGRRLGSNWFPLALELSRSQIRGSGRESVKLLPQ